jgi:hypothetical protein
MKFEIEACIYNVLGSFRKAAVKENQKNNLCFLIGTVR